MLMLLPLAQQVLLTVLPQGGQQVARRNAWRGMVDDAQRARARREVAAALAAAVAGRQQAASPA